MREKKLIAIASVILAVSLSGCGSSEPTEEAEVTSETEAEEETAEETEEEEEVDTTAEAEEYYEKGRACLYGLDGIEIDYEAAFDNFEQAKELGKEDAGFYLGALYDWYKHPVEDYEKAKSYYEENIENPNSELALAFLYNNGDGVEQDKEKAKEMFQSVIDKGCVEGYLGLASEKYLDSDFETALEYYNKVIEEGTEEMYVSDALCCVGDMYRLGNGVEQDADKAQEYYEKAAGLGRPDAYTRTAAIYYYEQGVEKDEKKAFEYYEKAANMLDCTAMISVSTLYFEGIGVEKDVQKGMEWLERAVDQNYIEAMAYLGNIYSDGAYGINQDYGKALELFMKAAELGSYEAMRAVGVYYEFGYGTEQDYQKAVEWYEKAIDGGDPFAMNRLGMLYFEGNGVEKDLKKALELCRQASNLGVEEATDNEIAIENELLNNQ